VQRGPRAEEAEPPTTVVLRRSVLAKEQHLGTGGSSGLAAIYDLHHDIHLGLVLKREPAGGKIIITEIIEDSPAFETGLLQAGDVLDALDQTPVRGMDPQDIDQFGPLNTSVVVHVTRGELPLPPIPIVRVSGSMGVGLCVHRDPKTNKIHVESILSGSPADNSSRILAGDLIDAIHEAGGELTQVQDWHPEDVQMLLRGQPGTRVTLHLARHYSHVGLPVTFSVTLTRMGHRLSHYMYKDQLPSATPSQQPKPSETELLREQAVSSPLPRTQTQPARVTGTCAFRAGGAFELGVFGGEEEGDGEDARPAGAAADGGGGARDEEPKTWWYLRRPAAPAAPEDSRETLPAPGPSDPSPTNAQASPPAPPAAEAALQPPEGGAQAVPSSADGHASTDALPQPERGGADDAVDSCDVVRWPRWRGSRLRPPKPGAEGAEGACTRRQAAKHMLAVASFAAEVNA